jgi:ABC-type amino acid transport substrate-binding protein
MKKFLVSILICLFCLPFMSEVRAEDPLNTKQRAWLKKHGTIRVGAFNFYPPFGFVDETGDPQGMAIDFWRLLSSKLDFWVQFFPTVFKNQLDGLKSGQYDSLTGIFPLMERRKFFDFSKTYTIIRTYIYVKPKHSHLTSLRDIKGFKVGAVEGDSGQDIARQAGLNPFPFGTYKEAVFNLANGDTDAIIMDELVVTYYIAEHKFHDKITKIGKPVDEGKMTLPVRKGNTILLDILNKGVDMVSKDEWEKIEEDWLGHKR